MWGRINEHSRKLALLYAIRESTHSPRISLAAAQCATQFVMHQTRCMLFMAQSHVAENPFHAECLRFLQGLRDAPNRTLLRSVRMQRMKLDAQTFQKIVLTLSEQGDIETASAKTSGRFGIAYHLLQP